MANSATLGTSVAAHIAVIDGKPTTTTRDIAAVYDKQHDNVLRVVRQRMAEAPATYPVIRMTKKGFHFVVGKFTGAKAVQHQIAFADEFERMEHAITSGATDRISPAQAQHLRELVLLVVESGKQGHAETWSRLCRKMKVNKYELLHPSQFDAACEYLKGKMDDQSMAALVKKHFPDAVASLPAPETTIDVQALLLKGQDAEPVAIPPEVEQAIDKQAWILAHDAYALLREHMRKRMAYSHTKGYPVKTLDTRSALAAIKTLTLGAALAHTAHSEMKYALGAIRTALHAAEDAQARVQEQIALNVG